MKPQMMRLKLFVKQLKMYEQLFFWIFYEFSCLLKNCLSLLRNWKCFVSKCRLSLDGFIISEANISKHITHLGQCSSFSSIKVNPNFIKLSWYLHSFLFGNANIFVFFFSNYHWLAGWSIVVSDSLIFLCSSTLLSLIEVKVRWIKNLSILRKSQL